MAGKKKSRSLRCPTCRVLVTAEAENFPFCSDRCRLIDLGKWASGGYVISSKINDPEFSFPRKVGTICCAIGRREAELLMKRLSHVDAGRRFSRDEMNER
jgi:endogenous inhibitor of DNA gyrase (YacG/DUF329 family)